VENVLHNGGLENTFKVLVWKREGNLLLQGQI
jgi:hypothetical protein